MTRKAYRPHIHTRRLAACAGDMMRTIALSEVEAREMRGAAWGYWQDGIGDKPSLAEQRMETAGLAADRESIEAQLGTVRGLLVRLQEGPLHCICCGVQSEALSADGDCSGCEERSLLQDQYAATVIEVLLQRLMAGAAEYVAGPDLSAFASNAVDEARVGRRGCTEHERVQAIDARLQVLAEQRKALEVA